VPVFGFGFGFGSIRFDSARLDPTRYDSDADGMVGDGMVWHRTEVNLCGSIVEKLIKTKLFR